MAPSTRSRQATSRNQSLAQEVADERQTTPIRVTDEELLASDDGAPSTLEDRIAAAEKKRDELRALQRLRILEDEIAQLQDLEQI